MPAVTESTLQPGVRSGSRRNESLSDLLATKPLDLLLAEAHDESGTGLRRVLGPVNLVTLGIGAIIGAGIFVFTGSGCIFAGLCYAEFASLIPIAGSAYTYGYATLGEIFAWIIGWDLIIEYAFGAATVASGWSGYVLSLLQDFHIHIPPWLAGTPGAPFVMYNGRWEALGRISKTLAASGIDPSTLPHQTGVFNLVAFLGMASVTTILVIGIKESANANSLIVVIKVCVLLIFIALGTAYILRHTSQAVANWTPFLPPNQGEFGKYGWSGVVRAAGVIFFAYIGFDAVSTAAQEAKNPKRDMPIGILGSLVICTILYILVAGVLTGLVKYDTLNVPDPIAIGIDKTGVRWGSLLVKLGAICGLTSTMVVMLLGQSRVFFSMSKDRLLPEWFCTVHTKCRTPYISSIFVGIFVAIFASVIPIAILGELVSIGTLLAFVIVCAGVWMLRRTDPELPRPFKTPLVPFVPIMGALISLLMMAGLPADTWLRLIIWLIIGMVIYFSYGRYHSRVQLAEAAGEPKRAPSMAD